MFHHDWQALRPAQIDDVDGATLRNEHAALLAYVEHLEAKARYLELYDRYLAAQKRLEALDHSVPPQVGG